MLASHVNKSTNEWTASAHILNMPLSAIKFLGVAGVDELLEQREALGGSFVTVGEFMRVVPKRLVRARAREALLMLGGFSGMFDDWSIETIENIEELLGLKEVPFGMKRKDKQIKYLGFIVPDRELLEEFAKHEKMGWTTGIIKAREKREGKYGTYVVYKLSPSGLFWSSDVRDLQKGQALAAEISTKNGKAKRIKLL